MSANTWTAGEMSGHWISLQGLQVQALESLYSAQVLTLSHAVDRDQTGVCKKASRHPVDDPCQVTCQALSVQPLLRSLLLYDMAFCGLQKVEINSQQGKRDTLCNACARSYAWEARRCMSRLCCCACCAWAAAVCPRCRRIAAAFSAAASASASACLFAKVALMLAAYAQGRWESG